MLGGQPVTGDDVVVKEKDDLSPGQRNTQVARGRNALVPRHQACHQVEGCLKALQVCIRPVAGAVGDDDDFRVGQGVSLSFQTGDHEF